MGNIDFVEYIDKNAHVIKVDYCLHLWEKKEIQSVQKLDPFLIL